MVCSEWKGCAYCFILLLVVFDGQSARLPPINSEETGVLGLLDKNIRELAKIRHDAAVNSEINLQLSDELWEGVFAKIPRWTLNEERILWNSTVSPRLPDALLLLGQSLDQSMSEPYLSALAQKVSGILAAHAEKGVRQEVLVAGSGGQTGAAGDFRIETLVLRDFVHRSLTDVGFAYESTKFWPIGKDEAVEYGEPFHMGEVVQLHQFQKSSLTVWLWGGGLTAELHQDQRWSGVQPMPYEDNKAVDLAAMTTVENMLELMLAWKALKAVNGGRSPNKDPPRVAVCGFIPLQPERGILAFEIQRKPDEVLTPTEFEKMLMIQPKVSKIPFEKDFAEDARATQGVNWLGVAEEAQHHGRVLGDNKALFPISIEDMLQVKLGGSIKFDDYKKYMRNELESQSAQWYGIAIDDSLKYGVLLLEPPTQEIKDFVTEKEKMERGSVRKYQGPFTGFDTTRRLEAIKVRKPMRRAEGGSSIIASAEESAARIRALAVQQANALAWARKQVGIIQAIQGTFDKVKSTNKIDVGDRKPVTLKLPSDFFLSGAGGEVRGEMIVHPPDR